MFSRRPSQSKTESFIKTKESSSKKGRVRKNSFRDRPVSKNGYEERPRTRKPSIAEPSRDNNLAAAVVTLIVGPEQRIFAAHEDVLTLSPFFHAAISNQFLNSPASPSGGSSSKRLALPDESAEVFSSVLEFLYKGDYYPRLILNKRKNTWEIEKGENGEVVPSTLFHPSPSSSGDSSSEELLKDTAIYCAAEKYGLTELKKIALRKQGLQSGIQCSTIITSARYAYANTPDTDSKLRAHYLALIIRSRNTFKRSGTMQMEMGKGGSQLFFDLFVALCNHVDDVATATNSPRSLRHT